MNKIIHPRQNEILAFRYENYPDPNWPKSAVESDVEKYLVHRVAELKGTAFKWGAIARPGLAYGHRGAPDRICIFPGFALYFAELKATNKWPTHGQFSTMLQLQEFGARICWIDCRDGVDQLIDCFYQNKWGEDS